MISLNRVAWVTLTVVHLLAADAPIRAQAPNVTRLEKVAVVGDDFVSVNAVRELSDGKVLVTDFRLKQLLIIDRIAGSRRIIGRNGQGPGEYQAPRHLFGVGRDSTVLVSSGGRWQLLVRDRFVGANDRIRPTTLNSSAISGMDLEGNVLQVFGIDKPKPGDPRVFTQPLDASAVVAVVRVPITGVPDTVARIHGGFVAPTKLKIALLDGIEQRFELGSGLPTSEQAVMFADGRIAIAAQNPYRIDWVTTNGTRIKGTPIGDPLRPVTTSVKQQAAALNRMPNARAADFPYWPVNVPPFGMQALRAGADGRVYVRRTLLSHSDEVAYDAIAQSGVRTSFTLPPRSRLVGSGRSGLYVVTKDDDDIETLLLYKTPP